MTASVTDFAVGKFMSATHKGIVSKPSFGAAGAKPANSGSPTQSTAMASWPCRSSKVSKS